MATSITLNSVALNSGNNRVTRILHDSAPVMDINALEINRRDGAQLISTNFKPKEIEIEGWITNTTQALLEDAIDDLKRDVCKSNINLDIAYAGSTRRYVVTENGFSITREGFDLTKVRYSLSLLCLTPFALSPTEQEALSVVGITSASYQTTITVDGSAPPEPTINYTIDNPSNLGTIVLLNNTTGKQIEVGTAFGSGDILSINCEDKTVTRNGSQSIEFEGVFPEFDLGINTLTTTFIPQGSLDQQNIYDSGSAGSVYGWIIMAQSFTAGYSTNYDKVELLLRKQGSPSDLTLNIYSNSAGAPGTILSSTVVSSSSIGTDYSWVTINITPLALTASTLYWIGISSTSSSYPNYYDWKYSEYNPYAGGSVSVKPDKTSDWVAYTALDATFKVYRLVTMSQSIDWEINYYPRYL